MSDVSDFTEDHEGEERCEIFKLNKGLRTIHLNRIGLNRPPDARDQRLKALERSDAMRDVPLTLPKLKFMENE